MLARFDYWGRNLITLVWTAGEGLGSSKNGIADPIMAGDVKMNNLGVGAHNPGEVTAEDDIYEQYKKRMMLGYRYRPNPLVFSLLIFSPNNWRFVQYMINVVFTNEFSCVTLLFPPYRTILGKHTIEQPCCGKPLPSFKKYSQVRCWSINDLVSFCTLKIVWILLSVNCGISVLDEYDLSLNSSEYNIRVPFHALHFLFFFPVLMIEN